MFKNSKTSIIIFAVLVVAAIAFFPTIGSNVKEYKDTNGENDFSLCKITDEDIILMKMIKDKKSITIYNKKDLRDNFIFDIYN